MKKKLLSIILAAAMSCATFVVPSYASEAVSESADEINLITSHTRNSEGQLHVSWINPDYQISGIKLYKADGTDVSGDGISLVSGVANTVTVTGLTSGTVEEFTLEITKSDSTVENFKVTGMANSVERWWTTDNGYTSYDWKFEQMGNGYAGRYIDSVEKHNGNSSLKFVKNAAGSGKYLRMVSTNKLAYEKGSRYKVSFWAKQELSGGYLNWAKNYTNSGIATASGNDWEYFEYVFDCNYEQSSDQNYFAIMVPENAIGTAWIDDIEVYKIDTETGKRIGNNLLTNTASKQFGFFDEGTKVTVKGLNSKALIKWQNPETGSIQSVAFTDSEFNTIDTDTVITNRGAYSKGIEGLTNGAIYDYYIKQVVGGVTEYVPVSVVPKNNTYSTSTPSFITENGYSLNKWTSNGWGTMDRVGINIDTKEYHGGNGSLHLKFTSGGWGWLQYCGGVWNLDSSKEYELRFWTKGSFSGKLDVDNTSGGNYLTLSSGNDWTLNTYKFTGKGNLAIRFIENAGITGEVWIDDIGVYEIDENGADVTGENLMKDGAFDVPEFSGALAVPAVSNGIATVYATWDKIDNSQIRSINVIDENGNITQGTDIDDDLSGVTLSGLEPNKEYIYDVVYDIACGEPIKGQLEVKTDNNLPVNSVMWTYSEGTTAQRLRQTLDTEVKHSGKTSLKLQTNYKTKGDHTVIPATGLDASKTYQVSLWMKLGNVEKASNAELVILNDWAYGADIDLTNKEWQRITFTSTGKSEIKIRLLLYYTKIGAMWIDDVIVREVVNGIAVGNNLLTDGGYENSIEKMGSDVIYTPDGNNMTVTFPIYNAFTASCYAASYDENGKLIAVDKAEINNDGNVNQEVSATVDTEGASEVKAFFWNGMTPWTGLMGTTIVNEAN